MQCEGGASPTGPRRLVVHTSWVQELESPSSLGDQWSQYSSATPGHRSVSPHPPTQPAAPSLGEALENLRGACFPLRQTWASKDRNSSRVSLLFHNSARPHQNLGGPTSIALGTGWSRQLIRTRRRDTYLRSVRPGTTSCTALWELDKSQVALGTRGRGGP